MAPAAPPLTESGAERDFHDEYVLREKLGQGTFAVVYAATHQKSGNEQFVVKVMDMRDESSRRLDFDDKDMRLDGGRIRHFSNEEAMLRVVGGCDNICRMSEHFMHRGLGYILLERCDKPLCEALEGCATLNEKTLRPFFQGMLTGIVAIHDRGVVHRDVKPDNFMCCGPDNTVKLCDFGLACAVESAECSGVAGTLAYMAPEILQREEYGTKVDVWSFGIVAHVLLRGSFPYTPYDTSTSAMKEAIFRGTPTQSIFLDIPGMIGSTSATAMNFVIKMLSKAASLRPASREALRDKFFTSRSLSQVCLRRGFQAAKCRSAFVDINASRAEFGDVDLRLRHLQAHRCPRVPSKMCSSVSLASTTVGSSLGGSLYMPNVDDPGSSGSLRGSGAAWWWPSNPSNWLGLADTCCTPRRRDGDALARVLNHFGP